MSPRLSGTVLSLLVTAWAPAAADEPLHVRIDKLIAARADGLPASARSDDAEFLRRVCLDLAGRIPAADEARAFLADPSPDKRSRLIDRLLDGPDFPRRMADALHVMLMERRGDDAAWLEYLRRSFEAGRPMDRMVADMLRPDPGDPASAGAEFFLTKRLEKYGENPVDYPGLTRDVGRLFLGVDLQCAQCHNHLFVDDYKQRDFQGLFAFFRNASLGKSPKGAAMVVEKPLEGRLDFSSVFDQEQMSTWPRLPGGQEIPAPAFKKGEEYRVPPDPKTRTPGVPKFSPLEELSRRLPTADNAAFARNLANRLWFLMTGRGLVHPLDLHHSANPPSHPELLRLLAKEFAAGGFDVRRLLREIALSDTYQRSGLLADPAREPPPEKFLTALEKGLSAEQLYRSVLRATGTPDPDDPAPEEKPAKSDDPPPDPKQLRARFVKAFAAPAGEPEVEFAPSLKSALFVLHDEQMLSLLRPRPGNLIDRLMRLPDPDATADELYLSVLSRRPVAEERAEVRATLERHPDRRAEALGRLAWALLASTEFCVNH
jgi:hypothetical protein